jgi:hypothetical protein
MARAAQLMWTVLACSAGLQGCQLADAEHHPVQVGKAVSALRPVAAETNVPPYFAASDKVEQHDSGDGFFRVHYTRSGEHAVPATDRNGDGTPDYVAQVAADFDRVLAFYTELGYREPVRDDAVPGESGGDDRFDVYLLDFAIAGSDGQFRPDTGCDSTPCGGYMMLENDFNGRGYETLELAIRLVSSHELFHAVQQAYATGISGWLSEGTAVWASEAFDAEAGDVERLARAYFERPEGSLAQDPMGTDPIIYSGGVFFQFIDEHADRTALRRMFEILSDTGDSWPLSLDAALREADSSLAEQFSSFVEWNLFTAGRADPERAYARGEQLPLIKERKVEPGFQDDAVRVFPLAARYYALQLADADSVIAQAKLQDDALVDNLQLLVAVEHDGKIGRVERANAEQARSLEIEGESGDTVHVVLYNTAAEGSNARPDLCITTGSERALCEESAEPDAGEPGEGEPSAKPDSDGGCSALSGRAGRPSLALVFVAIAGLVAVRRRARR